MAYCIIGAGAGGLASARHASAISNEVVVFEQTDRLGGTWVYTNDVGHDRNGLPIHTSMYKGLRSNIPKQTMGYLDSAIDSDVSYVKQEEVLRWLEDYAEKFHLNKLIKFEHHVIRVNPIQGGSKWEVIVKKLLKNEYEEFQFDCVMVCNGHYSYPMIPEYPGRDQFNGLQIHSHDYRSAERFAGEDLLVIGAGYSALDIVIATLNVAKSITISYHKADNLPLDFAPSVVRKPNISSLTTNGAKLVDGTDISCSVIIYCTGYEYSFPFLSIDCGIFVEQHRVQPLYKQLININHPSMALIGVPFHCCPTQMMDLQARFCVQFFSGAKKFPPKEDMLREMEADIEDRRRRGLPKQWTHKLVGDLQPKYYNDLAATAGVEPMKPVVMKIFDQCMARRAESLLHYRNDKFEVIDDGEFRLLKGFQSLCLE
ncbi:senecionine N-oxygenase-like [Toxorhynchites rutilus septentrionalis]|uniref:senecionine N-oxygenase-like n=1 Tax=Toxorhynchites rutilus septentrionalis TaxID=329112 RepID=UPI00247AC3B3|nr:senecionine N-oxygenase-like [Toxorhynchites rutilus septentrionalis]